jgi:hypothetical protein
VAPGPWLAGAGEVAEAEGLVEGLAGAVADPDPDGADVLGADVLGGVAGVGASWVQAAMTTRSLTGSALPPTPLRSTK